MDWIGAIGTLGGAVIGFLGGLWLTARQRGDIRETLNAEFQRQATKLEQQRQITAATASAGYAQRSEEYLRPSFDDVLAAARGITTACNALTTDIGDIPTLDRCIDRFESSPLTEDLARACVEMRILAVQYGAALREQQRLIAGMPRDGAPLDPHQGAQVVSHGERLEELIDRTKAVCSEVREAVRLVVQELGVQQQITIDKPG
jgi:hypothetical protein